MFNNTNALGPRIFDLDLSKELRSFDGGAITRWSLMSPGKEEKKAEPESKQGLTLEILGGFASHFLGLDTSPTTFTFEPCPNPFFGHNLSGLSGVSAAVSRCQPVSAEDVAILPGLRGQRPLSHAAQRVVRLCGMAFHGQVFRSFVAPWNGVGIGLG